MRDHAKFPPAFWTGDSGRRFRKLTGDAQVVLVHLLTGPLSHMSGLYWVPVTAIAVDVGRPLDATTEAVNQLQEAHFIRYDDPTEFVWVVDMARDQVGETLAPGDNRIAHLVKHLQQHRLCPFAREFYLRYRAAYQLPQMPELEAPSKPLPSPFEAPSKPLAPPPPAKPLASPFEGGPKQEEVEVEGEGEEEAEAVRASERGRGKEPEKGRNPAAHALESQSPQPYGHFASSEEAQAKMEAQQQEYDQFLEDIQAAHPDWSYDRVSMEAVKDTAKVRADVRRWKAAQLRRR